MDTSGDFASLALNFYDSPAQIALIDLWVQDHTHTWRSVFAVKSLEKEVAHTCPMTPTPKGF